MSHEQPNTTEVSVKSQEANQYQPQGRQKPDYHRHPEEQELEKPEEPTDNQGHQGEQELENPADYHRHQEEKELEEREETAEYRGNQEQQLEEPGEPADYHGNQEKQVLEKPEKPSGETTVNMPMPGQDWALNMLLSKLAPKISEDELKVLKGHFVVIIGRGVLEGLNTAADFFDHLRKQTFLSRDNLLYLQTILRTLNRTELIEMAIEYAESVGDVLYFHEPKEEPPNGYRTFKFHVKGKDFRQCTQAYIDDLRTKVSALLLVPPQDVLIAGIVPSNSMFVTIMIPDSYADILLKMLQQNKQLQQLIDVDIDTVEICDTIYNIRGTEGIEFVETKEQATIVSVFHQLQDKSRQSEKLAEETQTLLEEKRMLEKKIEQLETESALCSTVIKMLLQENTTMVAVRSREESDMKIKQLEWLLKNLKSQMILVQHQLLIQCFTQPSPPDKVVKHLMSAYARFFEDCQKEQNRLGLQKKFIEPVIEQLPPRKTPPQKPGPKEKTM